jgi:hypothetical protein
VTNRGTEDEGAASAQPGECGGQRILAAGRASEILDLGDGRVLRRFKEGGDPHREAEFMGYASERGYPVPRVHEVRPNGLVLDYVAGPTMAADVQREPRRLLEHAGTLACLHDELHRIEIADGALLHLDLHWQNVLMSPSGPVVIDWANAAVGDPHLDDALTWVILMTSGGALGREFADAFALHVDVRSGLASAAAFRLADRNVSAAERSRVERLLGDR